MRRSDELAESLLSSGQCPVDALIRLAEEAEVRGELGQAIGAWKSILPYIYPKPKSVEIAPEALIQLARDLAAARAEAAQVQVVMPWSELLDKYVAQLSD